MKRILGICLLIIILIPSLLASADEIEPLLKPRVGWDYGKTGQYLTGFIPALDETVVRPWELSRWKAIFNFQDGTKSILENYDVFAVKKKPEDPKFDKENGFGLVVKSQAALGDLFDVVMKGQNIEQKQLAYFREKFVASADDEALNSESPFYYKVENRQFLRISGIIQRMGIAFDRTEKFSESDRRAHFNVSGWPDITVTTGSKLKVDFTANGYSKRYITMYAIPRGNFPNLTKSINLFDGAQLNTSVDRYKGSTEMAYSRIVPFLGKEVDIVLDDGYGRTAIKSVTLPDEPVEMDYVPIVLSLTESGQLWMKFKYQGEDFNKSEFVNKKGVPMVASVKIGGAVTTEFSMPSLYTALPEEIKDKQEFSVLLGKIDVGDKPGKYYIKVTAFVNNPKDSDRATEAPDDAYKNNEVKGEWTIDVGGNGNDLIAQSVTAAPGSIQVGGKSTISAKVKNVGSKTESNVLIRFYDNQTQIYEARKTLPANEVITVGGFNWTGSSAGVHNISVHVDPLKEKNDTDRTNNIATTGCSVSGSGSGETCTRTTANNNWTVTYKLITGYHTKTGTTTWTGADGKSHTETYTYTDYSDPIWESRNVSYQESLKISTEANTKQGIATDPKNPKTSDRESRGSWEIIPWARKSGLNPNMVTRAGYGFELKVTTNYETDWEEKVPKGLENTAKKIGGEYIGPKQGEVIAKIYNTKGRWVESVILERTSGGNVGQAIWQLPKKSHTFSDGQTVEERKYYTDKDWSDGNFSVVIVVNASGSQGNLEVCSTEKMRIYGSMYDDSQNIRQK
ncbi:hypothetical protein EJP82_26830 [Paenibacillus anaericanus]|uniref:CARDB domain-containing protein n=1 Tax=Paenibacillus anaericanus TaxID=170367 RepID=A0A3S1DDI0_9BACL|nr:CARDB domain-containing protein [Paenibacillus anaericanus]RUT38689.1 hypothetical protein EJP82_26830 [Paenibacillus anaericanus]